MQWGKELAVLAFVSLQAMTTVLPVCRGGSVNPEQEPTTSARSTEDRRWSFTPGETTRREILGDKVHVYQISLLAGQYLHLDIDTNGSNLVVTLFDSGLREVATRTSFQPRGIPLSFIADSEGLYTIKARLADDGKLTGCYELTVEPVRKATEADRDMVGAETLIAEAQRLRSEWRSASLLEAIKKYERAIQFLRACDNQRAEAVTHKDLGDTYSILSQTTKAMSYYGHVLSLPSEALSPELKIDTLNNLSALYVDRGDTKRTLECSNRAFEMSRENGYRMGEAHALNNIGLVHYSLSELDKALELFDRALLLWKELNNSNGQAEALANIGYAYSDLGDVKKAMTSFDDALALWQSVNNRRGQALVLTAMGLEYTWLGEPQKALNYHNEALQILLNLGDARGEAVALNGIGYAYDVLGDSDEALTFFHRALRLQHALGRRYGEAITMGHVGRIYHAAGDDQKALFYFRKKHAIVKAIGDPRAEGHTLRDIGTTFDALNQRSIALSYYNRALRLSRAARDPRGEAYCLNCIGYILDRSDKKQAAVDLYVQARALLEQAEDKSGQILTRYHIARVKRDLGNTPAALSDIRVVLDMAESLRVKVSSHDLRSSYFASVQEYYKLGIDLLMAMHQQDLSAGFDVAALEMSERARARSLLETLTEAKVNFQEGADPRLLQRETDLERLLNAETEHEIAMLNAGVETERLSKLKAEIARVSRAYEEIRAQIRATSPRYAALTQPQALTLRQIQLQVLDPDTVLLEFSLGAERSYLWAVMPDSIRSYVLPGRAKIETLSRRVLDLLTSRRNSEQGYTNTSSLREVEIDRTYWQNAESLSTTLPDPVARILKNKRLLIVAEGPLQYIPFSGLPSPNAPVLLRTRNSATRPDPEPLFLAHEVVNLPSASTLAVLRKQMSTASAPPGAIAIFADPVFESDDPRLNRSPKGRVTEPAIHAGGNLAALGARQSSRPGPAAVREGFARLLSSRREADTILGYALKEESLEATGFRASLSVLRNTDMARYHTVHFATHGLLDTDHPELSAIVLSLFDEQGKPQNGLLRLHEIYNLRLPVDLVVLSACNTALGKDLKGEGMAGITRGFMYAGATRVVSSIWKVDDDATAEFMKQFYERMLRDNEPATAALRSAQIAMWNQDRWRSPYYCAAFIFQGDWK